MAHLNVEIKAKCKDTSFVRQYLQQQQAEFRGTDEQQDTYFNVPHGRLKLREGKIENNLIYYERANQAGPKSSYFRLVKVEDAAGLKTALTESIGIKVVVKKIREICYIRNVKFHIDEVPGLGSFIEIEAGNILADLTEEQLREQCNHYLDAFGIKEQDLVEVSYSDMLLEKKAFEQSRSAASLVEEPAEPYIRKKYSMEEYLELERKATERHEFYKGDIFQMEGHGELLAMSGAAKAHNVIFANIFGKLAWKLSGKKCRPYGPDMRMHIPENTLYTYPDISIYCKEDFLVSDTDTAMNPMVIIEILSPSTRNYDMGEKFKLYRSINTLKEYILVDTQSMSVSVFRADERKKWKLEEFMKPDDILKIKSVKFNITLYDIYQDVNFPVSG